MKKRKVAARHETSLPVLFVVRISTQDTETSFPLLLSRSSSPVQASIHWAAGSGTARNTTLPAQAALEFSWPSHAAMMVTGSLIFIARAAIHFAPNATPFTPLLVFTWFFRVSSAPGPTSVRTSPALSHPNNPFLWRRLGQPSGLNSGLLLRLRFIFLFISPSLEALRLPGSFFGRRS